MTIGAASDEIIAELDQSNQLNKKTNRRNIIVRMDAVRSELLAAGNYDATIVNGSWQYNVANDLMELPDYLFITKPTPVLLDPQRGKYYSPMPSPAVYFKNKNGIRTIHALKDNSGGGLLDAPVYFTAQKAGEGVAMSLLESSRLLGSVGYEIEGQKIYYNNMVPDTYDNVIVTYMPTLTGLAESDELPCSGEFINMLLSTTKQHFMFQKQVPRKEPEIQ